MEKLTEESLVRASCLLLVGATLMLACASQSNAPNDTHSIWKTDSVGFSLEMTGGLQGYDQTYSYAKNMRTLSLICRRFCYADGGYANGPVQTTAQLSPDQDAQLSSELASLHESVDRPRCTYDALSFHFTVDRHDATESAFTDNSSAGCPQSSTAGPLIEYDDFDHLRLTLDQLLTAR
jgi:hypothetical protein